MRRKLLSIFFILFCLCEAFAQEEDGDWFWGHTISKIEIEGLKIIKKSEIAGVTSSFIGQPFTEELYSEIIDKLNELDFFEDIEPWVTHDKDPEKVLLVFNVTEYPAITKIEFVGNQKIRNGELFYTKYVPVKRNQFPFEYKYFYIKDGEINWVGLPYDNFMTHPQYYKLVHTLKKASISVLDLNIRYLNEVDGLNIWDNRKKHLIDVLLNSYCDVFFFQEITKTQFMYIDKYLNSAYEFVGVYRDSTDASEKCSISYNIFKYTLTDWGQFWLSSAPYEPGSNDFQNFFPRICTWAALKQINGINILFFNIHLDHVNFEAHLPCIKVALEESEKVINRFSDCQFVVLGGCFYCEDDDPVIDMVRDYGYTEAPHENTFHDFTGDCDRHWDYIFYKEKDPDTFEFIDAKVLKEEGTIDAHRQMFVSDHFPLAVQFRQINPHQFSD